MKSKLIITVLSFIAFLTGCQQTTTTIANPIKKGMVKVSILYPNEEGKTFDMDYYSNKHMPMVADLFGNPLKHYAIEKGIAGRTPDEPIPYLAIGYFYFDQLSDYQNAMGSNADEILSDIPNYTDIRPIVQISEVVK